MAIWQVAVHLIYNNKSLKYSDNTFLDSLQKIEPFFAKEQSWCKSIIQYGNIDSTCIEIDLCNENIIEDILIRIDLRNISMQQLQAICDFVKMNKLQIEYNNAIYEADIDTFMRIFQNSNAHHFLIDPQKYLQTQGDGSVSSVD